MKSYIILILLIVVAFAASLQNSFVWDDYDLAVENSRINLTPKEILSSFINPLWRMTDIAEAGTVYFYYRPVLYLFFAMNYKIWGLNPTGFHLVNILLHMITVIVLYRIGLLLFESEKDRNLISLIGASIFAVHPINNEPVGRAASGEVIFGFFVIMSLYFYLKEGKYFSLFAFFLALLTKETAVMLPFALVIFAIHRKGFKKGLVEITPYMVLVGIYLILRVIASASVLGGEIPASILMRALTMAAASFDYMRLLVMPYPMKPFYPATWYASVFDIKVVTAITVLLLIAILAFKIRKNKIMLFLLMFPLIMLAPVIWRVNTFSAGQNFVYIAERFLYVPAMMFSLFVSANAAKLFKDAAKKYMLIGWILVVSAFIFITVSSNMIWKNNLALFTGIVRESPDAAFAHINLGLAYYDDKRYDEAIEEYRTALRLNPNYPEAHNNLGFAYCNKGRLDEAIYEYKAALRLNPNYARAYNNLGNAYMALGFIDDAIGYYKIALRLNPNLAGTHNNLGLAYRQKGLLKEAIQEFQAALKIQPDFVTARRSLESLQK